MELEIESNVPPFAPTPGGCTHVSPGSCLFWLPPTPTLTQKRAPMDPKAKCKHALSSSSRRSRRGTGLWFSDHCSTAAARAVCAVRGHSTAALPGGIKSLSHSAPCKWMPHASFPGEEGPFRLFLAPGGQEEGVPLTSCYRL